MAADDTKSSSPVLTSATLRKEHKRPFVDEAIGDMDSDAPSAQRGVAESHSTPNIESNNQASELPCSPQQPSTPSAPMLPSEPDKLNDNTSEIRNLDAPEAKTADGTVSKVEQNGQFNEDRPDSVPEMDTSADDAAMLSFQDDASTHEDKTIPSEPPQDFMDDEISLLHVIDSPSRYHPLFPSPTANDEDNYTNRLPLDSSPTKKPAIRNKKKPTKENHGPALPAQKDTKPEQPITNPQIPTTTTPHYPSIPAPTADDKNVYTDLPPLDLAPEKKPIAQTKEEPAHDNDDPAAPAQEDLQTGLSSTEPKTAPIIPPHYPSIPSPTAEDENIYVDLPPLDPIPQRQPFAKSKEKPAKESAGPASPTQEDRQAEQPRTEPKTAPTITLSEHSPPTTPRKAEAPIPEAPAQSSKPYTKPTSAKPQQRPVQRQRSKDTQLDILVPLPQPVKRKPKYSYELYFFPKVRLVFLDTHRRYEARQAFPNRWGSL